jgi:hypothetical protein
MYIVKDLGLILLLILLKHYRPKRYLALDKPWFKLMIILKLKIFKKKLKLYSWKNMLFSISFYFHLYTLSTLITINYIPIKLTLLLMKYS